MRDGNLRTLRHGESRFRAPVARSVERERQRCVLQKARRTQNKADKHFTKRKTEMGKSSQGSLSGSFISARFIFAVPVHFHFLYIYIDLSEKIKKDERRRNGQKCSLLRLARTVQTWLLDKRPESSALKPNTAERTVNLANAEIT